MLTLEEYNIREAKKALESGVYNTIYSRSCNKSIDINNCCLDYLNKEDKEKVIAARENIKSLEAIANGEKIDSIYTLYYYNVYLKEVTQTK